MSSKKFFFLSVCVLFIGFWCLFTSPNTVAAQIEGYTLKPSQENINFQLSAPYSGYGVNVLLHKDGQLLMNQAGISYNWMISDPSVIEIETYGFDQGCPYNIYSPCPNLHSTLRGLKAGTAKVTVDAFLYGDFLAATSFMVTVNPSSYTLEPSESSITTAIHQPSEGYGVNVKLYADGQMVMDQWNVRYNWTVSNPIITLSSYGMSDVCPYDIKSPCPNLHAEFRAIKPGQTTVAVTAFVNEKSVAKTSFVVTVQDAYSIEFIQKSETLEKGIDYPFLIRLQKNGEILPYLQNVRFEWSNSTGQLLWIRDHQVIAGCPQPLVSPCSNISASVRGTNVGFGSLLVKAITSDGVELTTTKLPITVVEATAPVSPVPTIQTLPMPSVTPQFEGEKMSQLEKEVAFLKEQLSEQQAQLSTQGQNLEQQQKELKETQSLVEKIWAFLKSLFR